MRRDRWSLLLAGGMLLATAGCATGQEWATWRAHPSHFASGDHFIFSVRNTEDSGPLVTRADIALARAESWWGKPVTVTQEQILER